MARAIRVEHPGAVYHITSRGNRRKRIFNDDRDHERFLLYVAEAAQRFGWVITSYALMVNHFHLVLKTPRANLSRGMQWLNGKYAAYYNRRHRKVGHLFGERYKAIHVQSEEYLQRLSRYVVLNPVRANMAAQPEEFRWTSYRATAGLEAAPEWLAIDQLIPYFGTSESWRANYIQFVRDGVGTPDPIWKGLRRGIYLGTEQWLRGKRQLLMPKLRKSDIPLDQRAAALPSMTKIAKQVAAAFRVTTSALKNRRFGLARQIAAWLGVYAGARRLRVIAGVLGLRSCSRVTQLVQELDRALRKDPPLRKRVEALQLSFA
jgi:REP element-mobilizing transposase RayT